MNASDHAQRFRAWTVPKGTMIQIAGLPFVLTESTEISGYQSNWDLLGEIDLAATVREPR